MSIKSSENKRIEYACNGKIITFNTPLVMAILNLTPDSFYDGGKYGSSGDVLRDAEERLRQGADILDLGAASTRPDASDIRAEEEWQRLEEPLKALRKAFPHIPISIDTYHSQVARQSADCGADIINDISGGNFDTLMFETVAALNLPYVLMHIQGTPKTMQVNPAYTDVVKEVKEELAEKAARLKQLNFTKIILDPGFGFGKNNTHNYQLLKHLGVFAETGFPVLAGISRKRMINSVIGTNPVTALNGTTAANTIALLNGASILRVHDVAEARQTIRLVEFYKNA